MDIEEFRGVLAEQLEIDRKVTRHRMSGRNLDMLLKDAAEQLNVPLKQLDYEIEERGNRGFMRVLHPKDFKILVYRSEIERSGEHVSLAADMVAQKEIFAPVAGKMFVQVRRDGIYLKLTPPKNDGQPVVETDVLLQINRFLGKRAKQRLIRELCTEEACEYTKVADIDHRPKADARVSVQLSQDRMKATMVVTEPGDYGAHMEHQALMNILKDYGVTYGYDEEFLRDFCDAPAYNQSISIAEGKLPVDGDDLYIEIFDSSDEEPGEKVNVRSRSNASIISKGSVVGMLHQPSAGETGYNVLGEPLEASPGVERPYNIGAGCEFDAESAEITALISGELVFDEELQHIKIMEIYVVEGNLQNDIDFPGSVLIKGDVENGYTIKAEANITIVGHLGKTTVECGGQLEIKAGINAVDAFQDILIHVKGNIYTRYINNAGIYAGKSVIVEDGILGSTVFADEYVVCRGKRAVINASAINARLGIYAKNFGSARGTKTDLTVAMPKTIQEERNSLQQKYEDFRSKIKPLKQSLSVQSRQKEIMSQSGSVSIEMQEDIDQRTADLEADIEQVEEILRNINNRLQELEVETDTLSKNAFISSEKMLNPGVTISIASCKMDVQTEYAKGLTFYLRENEIHPQPLEEFDLEQFRLDK